MRGGVYLRSGFQLFDIVRTEFDLDLLGDRLGNGTLQFEHIAHIPGVGVRPDVILGSSVHEAGGDADSVVQLGNRAFNDVIGVEFFCDLRE